MIEGVNLPLQCASLCSTSIDVQRMAVKAAIKGDIELLKLAVLQDPSSKLSMFIRGSLANGR